MAITKTENGESFPAEAYAYVPDAKSPSTWKLRLWETVKAKVTARQVGMAVAALGAGFRGNKVEIPSADRAGVIARVRSAWKGVHGSTEQLPAAIAEHVKEFVGDLSGHPFRGNQWTSGVSGKVEGSSNWDTLRSRVEKALNETHKMTGATVDDAGDVYDSPKMDNQVGSILIKQNGNYRFTPTRSGKKAFNSYSNSIRGVEIFATGTHNGDLYTEADLDEMVAAFGALDYRPAIKVGHTKDTPGSPAYGWVGNLRRTGSKLVADFTDMHDSVVDAVRRKLYDNVSSEIYFNLKRGGKTFKRALKAVALLGAEVPAVANLVPLHRMEFAATGEFERVFSGEMSLEVSPEAMFECLSDRLADLIQLSTKELTMSAPTKAELMTKSMKMHPDFTPAQHAAWVDKMMKEDQSDQGADEAKEMKMRAEQLRELNEKLALITAQLAGIDSATDQEKDTQVKALSASIREISEQVKTLSGDVDESASARERNAAKAREAELQRNLKATQDQVSELQADGRRRSVAEKVAALKVPAFRPILEAVYAYALLHNAEKVKVYSKDKDGRETSADQTLVEIADGLVGQINGQATKLFKALAQTGASVDAREDGYDPSVGDDPGAELDRKIKVMQAEGKAKSYSEAMEKVLATDAELGRRYAEQTATRAASRSH